MGIQFKPEQLKAYFVCGSQDVHGDFVTIVKQAIDAGITMFQFRDKGAGSTLTPSQRLVVAGQIRKMCRDAEVPFVVDDDVELALAVGRWGSRGTV